MPGWWDAITPWDTDNEKKQKADQAAAAKALAQQRAQERESYQAPTRRQLLQDWAVTSKPTTGQTMGPLTRQQAQAQTQATADPVQSWRDIVGGMQSPTTQNAPTGQAYIDQFLADQRGQQMPSSDSLGIRGFEPPSQANQPRPQEQQQGWDPFGNTPAGGILRGAWAGAQGLWNDSAAAERRTVNIADEATPMQAPDFVPWSQVPGQMWNAGVNNFNLAQQQINDVTSGEQGVMGALGDYWNGVNLRDAVLPITNAVGGAANLMPDSLASTIGNLSGRVANVAGDAADVLQFGQDVVNSVEQPSVNELGAMLTGQGPQGIAAAGGERYTVGELYGAAGQTLVNQLKPNEGNDQVERVTPELVQKRAKEWYDTFTGYLRQYTEATAPTITQVATMSPTDLQKNKQRALLNWADPVAVANTYDQLVDRNATVERLTNEAKALYEQGAQLTPDERGSMWADAADLAAQAYALQNAHPQEIVNKNTNIVAQLALEVLQPDFSDLVGSVWSIIGATPKARRLTAVADAVLVDDAYALEKLTPLVVTAGNAAEVAAERSNVNKFMRVLTTATSKADIAADQMQRYVVNLMADVDTVGDARLLLRQLAEDPRKLITGMDANLFQSQELLDRAQQANGLVRFGSMGLQNNTEALRIYQQVANELLSTATSLNDAAPLLNKTGLITELTDAVSQGGYRYYGVANDLGNAPIGTVSARMKSVGGGEAVVEYLGDGGILGESAPMAESLARKQAGSITTQAARGSTSQTNVLQTVGAAQRKLVSPFYIFLSPGTWATNIVGNAATALGDGTLAGGRLDNMRAYVDKLWGVDPTARGLEGAAGAMTYAGQTMTGLKPLAPLKKAYAAIEENFGARVFHKSATHAMQKIGSEIIETKIAPILQGLGIADPKQVKLITNRLFEVGYAGGNITEEFQRIITGRTSLFSIGSVNKAWLEAVPPEQLDEFYNILRAAPNPQEAQAQLQKWYTNTQKHWDDLIAEAPTVPQRHVWMNEEVNHDMADIAQVGKMAERYAGASAADVAEWTKAAGDGMKEVQRRLQTLTQIVTEAADPKNRYMLYSAWGNVSDLTTGVRVQLGELAERIGNLPAAQRGQGWQAYFATARQLWDNRNQEALQVLERTADAINRGEDFAPRFSIWDNLERTARTNEDQLWTTLRLEPQSGTYDNRMVQVIEAGRQISDKAVARVYAAARRFNTVDAIDHIVSAEKNVAMAGAQARSYLDKVLAKALDGSTDWKDYYSIRNEIWRQLRVYERDVWGIAERSIVRDGLSLEVSTGLRFDAGPDGVVELLQVEKVPTKQVNRMGPNAQTTQGEFTQWRVRREDGTLTTVPDNMVPKELKDRYSGITPEQIDTEIDLELDNIASAHPFADDAQAIVDAPATAAAAPTAANAGGVRGFIRVDGRDVQGSIISRDGEYFLVDAAGKEYTGDKSQLFIITKDRKEARSLANTEALKEAEKVIAQSEDVMASADEARSYIRQDWDRMAKATQGTPRIDQLVATYTRNGQVRIPERGFEDLYGTTIAGVRIENQADIEQLVQEYVDMRKQYGRAQTQRDAAKLNYGDAQKAAEKLSADVRKSLNLGASNAVPDVKKAAEKTIANTTKAGGTQAPELSLAAEYAQRQLQAMYTYVTENLDDILKPTTGIAEGQGLRALDAFRQNVTPAWDNVRYIAGEYGNKMRSFALIDFSNNTRLDEIMGLFAPYSFWMTRSIKNSAERALFEPHIWRRVNQTEKYISDMREQRGDPQRFDGAIPVDMGNGTTYYLRVSPSKYWPTFGMFTQNDYADPESANSALGYAIESIRGANVGLYPWFDLAKKAAEGQTDDIYPASYLPQGRMIGWAAAAMTGYNLPKWARPGYYEYNIGRELTLMVSEKQITPAQAQYAQDMLRQMRTGEDPLPEQAALQGELEKILNDATMRAAKRELIAAGSSMATGLSVRPFNQIENQGTQAQAAYYNRQYDPVKNPYGSETAQAYTFDQYPELSPKFSQSSIYNEDKQRPGVSASYGQKSDETKTARDALFAAGDAAVEGLRTTNRDATKGEISDARAAAIGEAAAQYVDPVQLQAYMASNPTASYFDIVKFVTDTISEKYPSAAAMQGSDAIKTYNPVEQVERGADAAFDRAKTIYPDPVWPGEGASKEAVSAYYAAKDQVEQQRAAYYRSAQQGTPTSTSDTLRSMPQAGLAASNGEPLVTVPTYQEQKDKYKTPFELQRFGEIDQENAAKRAAYERKQAEWQARRGGIVSEFGDEAGAVWDSYYNLPKGDARKAYIAEHPEMKLYNMSAYNPTEYGQAKELFGSEALMAWANVPPYADTPEAKAARTAYFDQNRKAWVVGAWFNGRPGATGEDGPDDEAFAYNFGADYNEAKTLFGENIWAIVEGYQSGWNKNIKRTYFEKNPKLSEFFDWWYGSSTDATASAAGAGRTSGGTGRSYGGGGGGYVDYSQQEREQPVNIQMPYSRGLSNGLAVNYASSGGAGWRPSQADLRWLDAGRNLSPGKPKEGKVAWIRKTGGSY